MLLEDHWRGLELDRVSHDEPFAASVVDNVLARVARAMMTCIQSVHAPSAFLNSRPAGSQRHRVLQTDFFIALRNSVVQALEVVSRRAKVKMALRACTRRTPVAARLLAALGAGGPRHLVHSWCSSHVLPYHMIHESCCTARVMSASSPRHCH